MGLEAGSAPPRACFAGVGPGTGSLRYHVGLFFFPKRSWSWRTGRATWRHGPWTQGPRRCPHTITWGWCHSGEEQLPAGRGWLPWHRWPQEFRKFSEPSWRSPHPFIKSCCGFFNVSLDIKEPEKILCRGHGQQPWHLSNFGPDADAGFSLGPTSILGVEPSEPVWCASELREELPCEWPVRTSFCLRLLKVLLENSVRLLKWVQMICLGWM